MKLVMSTTVAAVCAAALVATPVDAKKHVKRYAPPAARQGEMAYGGPIKERQLVRPPDRDTVCSGL